MNYITGEKIQELTDHTIITHGQYYADEQLKRINCKYTYFDQNKPITQLSDDILNAKSIFVYTHILDFFFNKIYPLLTQPFILVSHNSDDAVTEKYIKYLNESKIINWYSQNVNYKHEKLISLPIGIANSQWPHGDLSIIDKIRNQKNTKEALVYKNFTLSTSVYRKQIDILTNQNGIMMDIPQDYSTYLTKTSKSLFCICPVGNGIDSHRIWECLYLNTIPILDDCINFRFYEDLPMLYVDNWSKITPEYLMEVYNKIINRKLNLEKLDLNFWRGKLC